MLDGDWSSDVCSSDLLYYRLNVVPIHLPPLRERREDIILLANHFLVEFCRDMGKPEISLSPEVCEILLRHVWNGNVRELRNVIERMVIFAKEPVAGRDLLPPEIAGLSAGTSSTYFQNRLWQPGEAVDSVLTKIESTIIREALMLSEGNKSHAAELLGISRFALNRRLERLRLATQND
jgi:two-component system response regulator AtoC